MRCLVAEEGFMLGNYFGAQGSTTKQKQILTAVQAALEIIKASISSSSGQAKDLKLPYDIDNSVAGIEPLANAIQKALENIISRLRAVFLLG